MAFRCGLSCARTYTRAHNARACAQAGRAQYLTLSPDSLVVSGLPLTTLSVVGSRRSFAGLGVRGLALGGRRRYALGHVEVPHSGQVNAKRCACSWGLRFARLEIAWRLCQVVSSRRRQSQAREACARRGPLLMGPLSLGCWLGGFK